MNRTVNYWNSILAGSLSIFPLAEDDTLFRSQCLRNVFIYQNLSYNSYYFLKK